MIPSTLKIGDVIDVFFTRGTANEANRPVNVHSTGELFEIINELIILVNAQYITKFLNGGEVSSSVRCSEYEDYSILLEHKPVILCERLMLEDISSLVTL